MTDQAYSHRGAPRIDGIYQQNVDPETVPHPTAVKD
jgi:hypothetical protein